MPTKDFLLWGAVAEGSEALLEKEKINENQQIRLPA